MSQLRNLFPARAIGTIDLTFGAMILGACFLFFYHIDIWYSGWHSLNYLFGRPLDFYENCKKGPSGVLATYPPPVYLLLAFWLYPFKVFGLITTAATFPYYWVYWLKVLTTITYAGSGAIFHKIAKIYVPTRDQARYATALYLAMPLALFSEFLFSQLDVFHVFFTLAGVLMFLRGRVGIASCYFGIAVSFKYFPALVYIPLLFLNEKRLSHIIANFLIFILPSATINLVYRGSPAFVDGVQHFDVINRVYAATFDLGLSGVWKIYVLPAAAATLCACAYFTDVTAESRLRYTAYYWLVSSILPFLFIFWYPQWLIAAVPPMVLTTILHRNQDRLVLLDLLGMLAFVATASLTFPLDVGPLMFAGSRLGLPFTDWYWLADVFEWFGDRSRNVFCTGFFVYLVLQVILKRELFFGDALAVTGHSVDYGKVRLYFYAGLAVFLAPMSFVVHEDLTNHVRIINNAGDVKYGSLATSRTFEQTFVAVGNAIKQIRLPLETASWSQQGDLDVEVLDSNGIPIARKIKHIYGSQERAYHTFSFDSIPVVRNEHYRIRVSSPTKTDISWWASGADTYENGQAIVDGVPEEWDFAFVIDFAT